MALREEDKEWLEEIETKLKLPVVSQIKYLGIVLAAKTSG